MKYKDITTTPWADYELIDSGDGRKLERFASVITDRPETQALWSKQKPELWKTAVATFDFVGTEGKWKVKQTIPIDWNIGFTGCIFKLHRTAFKHVGLFPEHASQWQWVMDKVTNWADARQAESVKPMNILNLFGYTGAASVTSAKAGAKVTHVDSSKQAVEWAKDNAELSGLQKDAIRWVIEDALAFVRREVRRGNKYDGILLDPPAFGRGEKGQVWHIEKDLLPLLQEIKPLLSDTPDSFILLSGYAAGYAPHSFAQLVDSVFGKQVKGDFGHLNIQESETDRVVPTGIYVRLVK